ncbi:MAG TPA: carboxymuconolactone decarboxylase family protein [Longimicrobiaceae bacterium]|nr:carboxymuconolactone decarboxylase family protein [Longimicrobiaceae bacterium]
MQAYEIETAGSAAGADDAGPGAHGPRLDYVHAAPGALRAMMGLETYVRGCGMEHALLELVKLRASYVNGCAYCVDMHTRDARAAGETEQRLYAVAVWHEAPFFTPRERAALAWTDAVTDVAGTGVPDAAYAHVRRHFSEAETVNLTMAIVAINGWNRLAISFRTQAGTYTPPAAH